MVKIEKKYLSFAELKDRWGITSDELHYLIQDKTIIPSIAWNDYVKNCNWEPDPETNQIFLIATKGSLPIFWHGWLHLRIPTISGNCNYEFEYASIEPYSGFDNFLLNTWFRLLDGSSGKSPISIGREFVEKNAVFMTEVIDNAEVFEFGLDGITNEKSIANKHAEKNIYSTDLLNLMNLAITQFFNPRHKKDAKKNEITEWIKMKGKELDLYVSDNVADSIFTIIKPNDHNPKIKRVEPLE